MSKAPHAPNQNPLCRAKRNCDHQWTHNHCKFCDEPCAVNANRCAECDWELRSSD